ncbi:MAG: UDP-N-acetylmuramate--L-alanine ligase, partial [Chloroflexota bacterium]
MSGTATLPELPAHVHFVGIGGIGMSGLARILHRWGYRVTGSDGSASPLMDELAGEGITVEVGHTMLDAASTADLVVMTAAVNERNPEVAAAIAAGRPMLKRAALLGALMNTRSGIAVAGSHGKSTTSGMITTALLALGADPSYAVGATVAATGTNAAPGTGDVFVVEADEYDRSFLHLNPEVAVVTNIEYDHPDIYPDLPSYDEAFAAFLSGVRAHGTVVLSADDPGTARVRERDDVRWPAQLVTFGTAGSADWEITLGPQPSVQTPEGDVIPLALLVPGEHNVRNAVAAMAAMRTLGYPATAIAEARGTFRGVGRRGVVKGAVGGGTGIDD